LGRGVHDSGPDRKSSAHGSSASGSREGVVDSVMPRFCENQNFF
jgi:hypothetical protein